jgi:peroxiredoxin
MMIRCKHLLFFTTGLIILLFVAGSHTEGRTQTAAEKADVVKAADFSLKDLDGREFTLSGSRRKPILLIFATTWCGFCRAEIPHFKDIYNKYGRRGLEVVYIDIQEPRERVARFSRRYDLPYRILLDEEGRVAESYRVMGVPTLVLIDRQGNIICWQCRRMDTMLEQLFKR